MLRNKVTFLTKKDIEETIKYFSNYCDILEKTNENTSNQYKQMQRAVIVMQNYLDTLPL